jgi:hypothetical protein
MPGTCKQALFVLAVTIIVAVGINTFTSSSFLKLPMATTKI